LRKSSPDHQTGWIDSKQLYDFLMNKVSWSSFNNPRVYLNDENIRLTINFKNNFVRLAGQLLVEHKKDSAIRVLDKCLEVMPHKTIPFNYYVMPIARLYYSLGEVNKGNNIVMKMAYQYEQELNYFISFPPDIAPSVELEKQKDIMILYETYRILRLANQNDLAKNFEQRFEFFFNQITN